MQEVQEKIKTIGDRCFLVPVLFFCKSMRLRGVSFELELNLFLLSLNFLLSLHFPFALFLPSLPYLHHPALSRPQPKFSNCLIFSKMI